MSMVFSGDLDDQGCSRYYEMQISRLENREKKLLAVIQDVYRRAEKALELCSLDDVEVQIELSNILIDCEEYVSNK